LKFVNKQQNGRGNNWIQEKKKSYFFDVIGMDQVVVISRDGKFPDFTYSCSELQLENPSFTAANHAMPLSLIAR